MATMTSVETPEHKPAGDTPFPAMQKGSRVRWQGAAFIAATGVVFMNAYRESGDSVAHFAPALFMLILWSLQAAVFVWLTWFSGLAPLTRFKLLAGLFVAELGLISTICVAGYTGNRRPVLAWRWAQARAASSSRAVPPPAMHTRQPVIDLAHATPTDWPGFRGSQRDGLVRGAQLNADWEVHPPQEVWRHPVGKGWSSFAIVGNHCLTQEQRGEFESVVCYELATGRECWVHADRAFYENVMGGDGPRATPTIDRGEVYTLGATGILNCLNGATGTCRWSKNVLHDTRATNCNYGMCGSPLVTEDLVIVCPGGVGASLVAYDRGTGDRIWAAGDALASYSSPQRAVLAGRHQVLIFNAAGLFGHDLRSGQVLWSLPWETVPEKNNVCQPVVLPPSTAGGGDRVWISSGYGMGCALLELVGGPEQLAMQRVWSNKNLKAKFTSVVEREGYLYGLDDALLTCINRETGERCWKKGRYGYGQLVLAGRHVLIQCESGEVALVEASPDRYQECARFEALSGRTWNHPALAGKFLVVRNDHEAACYELP